MHVLLFLTLVHNFPYHSSLHHQHLITKRRRTLFSQLMVRGLSVIHFPESYLDPVTPSNMSSQSQVAVVGYVFFSHVENSISVSFLSML